MKIKQKISCKSCGSIFQPRRFDHYYCSNACRTKAHREKHGISTPSFLMPQIKQKQALQPPIVPVRYNEEPNPKYLQLEEQKKAEQKKIKQLEYSILERERNISKIRGDGLVFGGVVIGLLAGIAIGFSAIGNAKRKDDSYVSDFLKRQSAENAKKYTWGGSIVFGIIGGFIGGIITSRFLTKRHKADAKALVYEERLRISADREILHQAKMKENDLIDVLQLTQKTIKFKIEEKSKPIETSWKLDTKSSKAIPMESLKEMKFKTLNFDGKWKELMGTPESNFYLMIHGKAGNGKSYFSIEFSDYLTSFGKVLFNSSEEGVSLSLRNKVQNFETKGIFLTDAKDYDSLKVILQSSPYKFVVIDSVNNMKITPNQLEILRKNNPTIAFIGIQQSTKDGNFKGSNEFVHNCDIAIKVENREATCEKSRYL